METIIRWIFKKLRCQRGEVGEDINAEDIQDDVFLADIDDEDYVEDLDETKDDDKKDDKEKDDKPAEEKPDKTEETLTELKNKVEQLEKDNARLGYNLRKASKPEDKKDKETPFTKAELMKLYQEHHADPDVVIQIFDEMTKLGKVDAQAAAEKSADIKNKQAQIDPLINQLYPDAKKEGSELNQGVQEAIKWAHLDGHPFADTLGLALLFLKDMPETIKKIESSIKEKYEKTSKEDLEEKAENARKGNINKGKLSKTGSSSNDDKSVSLTPKQLETAKSLGFTSKKQLDRYAQILNRKGSTMHAEA